LTVLPSIYMIMKQCRVAAAWLENRTTGGALGRNKVALRCSRIVFALRPFSNGAGSARFRSRSCKLSDRYGTRRRAPDSPCRECVVADHEGLPVRRGTQGV